jgi:hypothetical protein
MIDNFESIKQQLIQLAEVVNSFKSETVQLRIVDYLIGGIKPEQILRETIEKEKPSRKGKRKKTEKNNGIKKTKVSSGDGPYSMVNKLLETDFFKSPKTMKNIIEYCDLHFAKKIKANEISSKLARLVRDRTLTRAKNKDNQYEYKKP